jgi:hypothetical protein
MTAREEDILTSQNLIKKGVVIEKLIDSLILTDGIKSENLILGDRNAVMVAARILAYGPEYSADIEDPLTGDKINHTFDLTECPFKVLPEDVDYSINEFELTLPTSKAKIKFSLLTGKKEKLIEKEILSRKKLGNEVSPELTTRLKHLIVSVDGKDSAADINDFVDNMLSRDSLFLRSEVARITPDIDLNQYIDIEGEAVEVTIPMTVNFFWPSTNQ